MKNIPSLFALMLLLATSAHAQEERMGNFEIQRMRSAFNQAETLSSNLKGLSLVTVPTDYPNAVGKAAWARQSKWIDDVRSRVDRYRASLATVLQDSVVTSSEGKAMNTQCSQILVRDPDAATMAGPMLNRYRTVTSWCNALCTNENITE